MESRTVGILGGGQLGRMLAASASLLNIKVLILDVGEFAPAKQITIAVPPDSHIDGSFSDPEKIQELASKVDILTVEIEHVNVDVLEEIQKNSKVTVHPTPSTIRIIQDKYLQKQHLKAHSVPVVEYLRVDPSIESLRKAAQALGLPLMLKSRTMAYDGRGNVVVRDVDEIEAAINSLANSPLYAEKWVPFVKEVAVMVVRSTTGEVTSYPAVETVHKENICHLVFAPLRAADRKTLVKAQTFAEDAVKTLTGAGVFGVEMFLLEDGSLLVNEIAPRPHNSGHYTIEACFTSQYENHLRAILSLPIGSTAMKVPSAAMLNLLGTGPDMADVSKVARAALGVQGASVHLYGKSECRKGRKMGHITVVADTDAQLRGRLRSLLQEQPEHQLSMEKYAPASPPKGHSHKQPLVGIIMGSDSDLPIMLSAAHVLDAFHIPYELTIVSAHRTPERMIQYAKSAAPRGLRAIIAGAGGAAHLPGMVASMTGLPVIGVPVKGSSLDGVDSLHSIVQMPRGIPVATVAINNSTNAGLLAVRILGASNPVFLEGMDGYMKGLEREVLAKVDELDEVGWEDYKVKR